MQGTATEEQGEQIRRATEAMMAALDKEGTANDPLIALASVGALVGAICLATGNPGQALASVNALVHGMFDGTLLDP